MSISLSRHASAFARSPMRRRSSTNRAYSASLSSRTRSRKLGWTVTQASPPSGKAWPRPRKAGDGDDLAEQGARRGRAERDDERRADQRQLLLEPPAAGGDLAAVGLVVDAALAAADELEMLDRVGDVGRAPGRRRPRRARGRTAGRPGRRTGRPARSSWSPGCSPTNMMRASSGPSPNTVWVAAFVEVAAGAVPSPRRAPTPSSSRHCRRPSRPKRRPSRSPAPARP